ncbi:MAG: hypothetical protein N2050_00035 [Flavobacteriales bacterium]|nr:hypothetical protein [Flavobacteriales bacterium]
MPEHTEVAQKNFDLSSQVRLIVCDVDGTLTDGRIYIAENGMEIKSFDARDGLAMNRLNKNGVRVALLSHSHAVSIIRRRAEILNLEFWYAGTEKKSILLEQWMHVLQLSAGEVLYLGDDLNDLDAMNLCHWKACPSDACPEVRNICNIQLRSRGGHGVFREMAEKYFKSVLLKNNRPGNV